MDFRHLHLRGKLIAPSGIKTETVEVILMPNRLQTNGRASHGIVSSASNLPRERLMLPTLLGSAMS
jgi:hypothetical protein